MDSGCGIEIEPENRGPTFGLGGRTEISGLHSFVGLGASKTLGASVDFGVASDLY